MLLNAVADMNALVHYYGYSLRVAAYRGKLGTSQILLNASTEMNARDELYGYPLSAAAT
jgi:hypothetical protein